LTGDPREAIEKALSDLEAAVKRELGPSRYDARTLLIGLGELLLAGRDGDAQPLLERLHRVVEPVQEAWSRAVGEELSLACAEHVHAVDPRHLSLPNYDFAYTLAARERLRARLVAAEALDETVSETLSSAVERADAVLRPYLGGS